jgi:hypothetical protein
MMELMSHYNFLKCKLSGSHLEVEGLYTQLGVDYRYHIDYDGNDKPIVHIRSPKLIPHPPHTYHDMDDALCLFYPKKQPWNPVRCHLYSHTIPWTHEWILFYEIYLISGKWEHPEAQHSSAGEKCM